VQADVLPVGRGGHVRQGGARGVSVEMEVRQGLTALTGPQEGGGGPDGYEASVPSFRDGTRVLSCRVRRTFSSSGGKSGF
jgi:hypothetical protein